MPIDIIKAHQEHLSLEQQKQPASSGPRVDLDMSISTFSGTDEEPRTDIRTATTLSSHLSTMNLVNPLHHDFINLSCLVDGIMAVQLLKAPGVPLIGNAFDINKPNQSRGFIHLADIYGNLIILG